MYLQFGIHLGLKLNLQTYMKHAVEIQINRRHTLRQTRYMRIANVSIKLQACSHPHIVLILVLTTTERREEWAYGMI